jgi:Leucine-rich repeat (LRR) protein
MEDDWRNGYNPYSRSHSPPVMYAPQSNFMKDSYSNSGLLSSGMIKPSSNFMGLWQTQQLEKASTARNMMGQAHVHSRDAGTRSSKQAKETELIIGAQETIWSALDIGGLGLVNIAKELFKFSFITHLYLNHNQLAFLSPDICLLKNLKFLDLSGNKLGTLPPEIGLVTSLVELWLFDNQISFLPNEMGQLYQLEFLGIDGNNLLSDPFDSLIRKEGTSAAIAYLRDTCPGIFCSLQ